MQDWLDANFLTISEVAKQWGMAPIVLQRPIRGNRWPSDVIMVRCYQISNGKVTLADWIETCRPLLIKKGIIEGPTNAEEASTGTRGRRRSRKKEGNAEPDA